MNKKHSTYFTESLVRKSRKKLLLPNQLTDLLYDIYARSMLLGKLLAPLEHEALLYGYGAARASDSV